MTINESGAWRRVGAGVQPPLRAAEADAGGLHGLFIRTGLGALIAESQNVTIFDGKAGDFARGMFAELSIFNP